MNFTCHDSNWVVDSGAFTHVISYRNLFSSYKFRNFGFVKVGNKDVCNIGDISLKTNLGCKLVLRDVKHVPDIQLNLISTGESLMMRATLVTLVMVNGSLQRALWL